MYHDAELFKQLVKKLPITFVLDTVEDIHKNETEKSISQLMTKKLHQLMPEYSWMECLYHHNHDDNCTMDDRDNCLSSIYLSGGSIWGIEIDLYEDSDSDVLTLVSQVTISWYSTIYHCRISNCGDWVFLQQHCYRQTVSEKEMEKYGQIKQFLLDLTQLPLSFIYDDSDRRYEKFKILRSEFDQVLSNAPITKIVRYFRELCTSRYITPSNYVKQAMYTFAAIHKYCPESPVATLPRDIVKIIMNKIWKTSNEPEWTTTKKNN